VAIVLGTVALAGCSRESADWKSATAADTSEAYQQFLQQHPKSANAAQAEARIAQLAADRDWQAAAAADTRDAYERFIAQHADSKWAQEARIRIENFAQGGTTGGKSATGTAAAGAAAAAGGVGAAAGAGAGAAPAGAHETPGGEAGVAPPATAASSAAPPASTPRVQAARASGGRLASAAGHHHFVQLGAFHSKARAESEWTLLAGKYPDELNGLKPHFVVGKSRNGPVYKLRVAVHAAADARRLCATLRKRSQACIPVST